MIEIIPANASHIRDIQAVAEIAWRNAFRHILSPEQIDYMMNWMYSSKSLAEQMEQKNHRFFLALKNNKVVGYMSIEHNCEASGKTKIHKIYILPENQKSGIGQRLIAFASCEARNQNDRAIYLNVNKFNESAIAFYKCLGFALSKAEVIDIDNGFVMDDFVFEKTIVISDKNIR